LNVNLDKITANYRGYFSKGSGLAGCARRGDRIAEYQTRFQNLAHIASLTQQKRINQQIRGHLSSQYRLA